MDRWFEDEPIYAHFRDPYFYPDKVTVEVDGKAMQEPVLF